MPRRTQTYAIRLAAEGGGQVKTELVSVGQSGEQSLKRIETGGERASGGLKGLGGQAELLRTGIRTLGGALIGAATVGGLGALIDRSISAADAIGKTADKIGVGVEALQELRFAAKALGVEQQTLDMALQRFTRRAAEAAQGTGEAKDALAQMGIALRDQSGNLRLDGSEGDRNCTDTWRIEVRLNETDQLSHPLHWATIPALGVMHGEMFCPKNLAEDCAADRVFEFFFCAPPLIITGGTARGLTTLAIK